ncbi:MAG: DUF3027 domain-containing protein [Bifidobacteriaceae bacterium]|jgi:hypothetical protein|nr:DUF3027 domain-containing protein [Bifidobacteriaceae bacterium]
MIFTKKTSIVTKLKNKALPKKSTEFFKNPDTALTVKNLLVELIENDEFENPKMSGAVGDPLGYVISDQSKSVASYSYSSNLSGYKNWIFIITVSNSGKSNDISVLEYNFVASENSVLPPEWIPWSERIEPEDFTEYDVVPYIENDDNLITTEDYQKANLKALQIESEPESEITDPNKNVLDFIELASADTAYKNRIITNQSLKSTLNKWYEGRRGPNSISSSISSENCSTCAYFVKLDGKFGDKFGVCFNTYSSDEGSVISNDHGCGAHSETDNFHSKKLWAQSDFHLDESSIIITGEE